MSDLISRQAAIEAIRESTAKYTGFMEMEMYTDDDAVEAIKALPSVQSEEAIPVSWIEAKIERFMMSGDAFSGLTASIIRVMLNEWKKEQKGDTT